MAHTPERGVEGINISQEMKTSFLDYAMSVIVSRALPDVRDGLKPVHRRILYSMHEAGLTAGKPYKKSARIVGDVMGRFHPHGDTAIYDTMVRMAQDFSQRYELIDGKGNFGTVDGDEAAAMRYTESKMTRITMELLRDINKDTVDFQDNYDGQDEEPVVLPSRFPNLLVNGTSGIAVGMATNIPPHHLGEAIDGVLAVAADPEITSEQLMDVMPGPDFPTGGIILGRSGIRQAYTTGRGSITIRGKVHIEEAKSGKETIVITELPYQVNKARLVEKIAELVREKKIDGITYLADQSDREGMRVVIDIRRDVNANVVLNNLYKQTALQSTFSVNMLALVDGRPKVLTLKEVLVHYLEHQKEVIRRRTQYDLNRAEARAHILEGLRIALEKIDSILEVIRHSSTGSVAKQGLMTEYDLSERQAQAILDMRLQRLTGLEREKVEEEYEELQALIVELKAILMNEDRVLDIIREEIIEIKEKYADERRTVIDTSGAHIIEDEDLIPVESIVITLTQAGYIKRLPVDTYRSQRRGGRGVQGMGTNEDDFVEHLLQTSTHDTLLFFTSKGRVFKKKGYEIPEFNRTAKGIPLINLIELEENEHVTTFIPISEIDEEEEQYLLFATKNGIIKRSSITEYRNIRSNGLIALTLRGDDELISVRLTDGETDVLMATKSGMAIRFPEKDARVMGRTAGGVIGIRLRNEDEVVGMDTISEGEEVLVVTEKGYGKRTEEEEYREQKRAGYGLKTLHVTDKNGSLVAMTIVKGNEDLMIMTIGGVLIRMKVEDISTFGRNTQGVRLIRLDEGEAVATVAVVEEMEIEDETDQVEEEVTAVEEQTTE